MHLQYQYREHRDGREGCIDTALLMCQIVDEYKAAPLMRELALSIVSDLPGKDEIGECRAVLNWVRENIRYVKDIYDVETLATPDKLIEIGQGDCDDISTIIATLLESIGYKTKFKLVGYHTNMYEHVYVCATGTGVELHLDGTEFLDAGEELPGIKTFIYVG